MTTTLSNASQSGALTTAIQWIARGQLGAASQRAFVESGLRQVLDRVERAEKRARDGKRGDLEEALWHIERLCLTCGGGDVKNDALEWLSEKKRGGVA